MSKNVLEGKQVDLKDFFNLLESSEIQVNKSIKNLIQENLSSTKEAWLVHSLVDYYYASKSNSVVGILSTVQEPHDRYLLEKLHDGIRSQEHQQVALQLLLHILHRHPRYVKQVVTVPVLKVVIKCLKAENNIPILMTAVTIVTILLPSVPTLIGPYLPDLFEIFNRLASFSVKKPAGNTPDIFLLHLQISVYALFHRLYGMFPYNFLAYLRHFYTKKENQVVFDEVIKGMLERVRLHPLLIVGTKEYETSNPRWRQMETHDVVVECAKMSLDPIEGTWEELSCPVIASRQLIGRRSVTPIERPTNHMAVQQAPPTLPSAEPSGSGQEMTFCSPSEILGLSTPPSSQRATPAKPFLEISTGPSSQDRPAGPTLVLQHSGVTPSNTPRETPPITDEQDKTRSRNSSTGPMATKNMDPKRLSTDFPQITTIPQLTPSSNVQSVPPSPLKTEFTSVPPLGVKTLPVINAARVLSFDRDPEEDKTIISPASQVTSASQSESSSQVETMTTSIIEQEIKEVAPMGQISKEEDQIQPASGIDIAAEMLGDSVVLATTEVSEGAPPVSIDTLSQVIEDLENQTADNEDNDDEVSELTSSSISSGNSANITAESVAKFMKSVNRIRFNSLTVTNNIEPPVAKKIGSKHRSRSCPQFPKIDSMSEEDEEVSRSSSTMAFQDPGHTEMTLHERFGKEVEKLPEIKEKKQEQEIVDVPQEEPVKSEPQEVTVTMTTTKTTTCEVKVTSCPMYPRSEDPNRGFGPEHEFVRLLQEVLSPATLATCEKCRCQHEEGQKPEAAAPPFFSTFSPPELLDRHIRLGGEIHAKELSKIPMPSSQTVNWTHFGGVPPADEISIVRGQLMLMHNQLLYERHKREQHAKRNRRLLRKIANTKMLEEQVATKDVQLYEQDVMIRDLKVSLRLLQEENRKLKSSKDSEEYEKLVQLRSCLQENEDLKNVKKEFNMLLVRQREEQDALTKECSLALTGWNGLMLLVRQRVEHDALNKRLKRTESKLFNTEKELEVMQQHAAMNTKLKEQVLQLHTELLLMGELQQKSQEKLQAARVSRRCFMEQEQVNTALRAQLKELKSELWAKSTRLEGCLQQLAGQQESLITKESAVNVMKLTMESLKTSHAEALQSVEDKFQSSLRVNQALETQILQLYMEIEEAKFAHMKEERRKADRGSLELGASTSSDFRERSGSDPSIKPTHHGPLLRMVSSPAHTGSDSREIQKSFSSSLEHGQSGEYAPVIPENARGEDLHGMMERQTEHDRSETASIMSQDSTLAPGQQNLMYTDSEDNRSISNRSGRLGDSGFC